MCASALFTGLTREECLEIAACAKARYFARDELIFMQGHPARDMILLQAGSVKLSQISLNGNEVILSMRGKGDTVGTQSDGQQHIYTSSARAVERCKALSWEHSRVPRLIADYPAIRRNLNHILSAQLYELEERFREVATEKAGKRLALLLLRLVDRVGTPQAGGIQISLSREELAQMTGTTLFTISRILSRWAEKGAILPRREAVIIPDRGLLEAIGDEE
jgi:CRP-like cAMP-binding protein